MSAPKRQTITPVDGSVYVERTLATDDEIDALIDPEIRDHRDLGRAGQLVHPVQGLDAPKARDAARERSRRQANEAGGEKTE